MYVLVKSLLPWQRRKKTSKAVKRKFCAIQITNREVVLGHPGNSLLGYPNNIQGTDRYLCITVEEDSWVLLKNNELEKKGLCSKRPT